jgi:hypothetical protein
VSTIFTNNLKLAVNSNLTAEAKANLYKIDAAGGLTQQTDAGDSQLRAIENIVLQPADASIGGDGVGGSVIMGNINQPMDELLVHSPDSKFRGAISTLDQATAGTTYLSFKYNSLLTGGSVDTSSRTLSVDTDGADRSLILSSNLKVAPALLQLGTISYTLPSLDATLVDLDDTQTLTNKSISGASNTLSNISYSSLLLSSSIVNADISPSAAIAYSKLNLASSLLDSDVSPLASINYTKLNLSSSLVNADVAPSAGIVYSKLSLSNSITNSDISSSAAIVYSKLALGSSLVNADVSPSAAIVYSKLNLSGSILNSDISSSAAISGTKISPDFGAQNIRTTGTLELARNPSVSSNFLVNPSQSSTINYTLPASAPTTNQILRYNGSSLEWASAGAGTVSSVGLSLSTEADAVLSVSGSPITSAGTLSLDLEAQSANAVLAGPSSGGAAKPAFRSLVSDDIPTLSTGKLSDFNSSWDTRLATKTTSDLTEGSNLYYTADRFDTAFSGKDTDDLAEGSTNLYFTNSRADARITLQKAAANGLATLDAGGKIPVSQLPASVMEYKGTWNASTNSPILIDGVGDTGDVYLVNVAGTQDLGSGSISFAVGDWAVYNGSIWQKSLNSNAVSSVNGLTGIVVLTTSNIAEGSNLYYTPSRFDAAFATKLTTDLTEGTNLYYTDSRVDARLSTYKFVSTWSAGDGASKTITHSLGTTDISWNIFDIDSGEEIWPDTAIRTSINELVFTATVAPSGSGWRIVVRK